MAQKLTFNNNLHLPLGGFGDFYTMKRSQHIRPESFWETVFGGYEELLKRVTALERKTM